MQCDKINPILLFLSFSHDIFSVPHPKHCFVELLQRAPKNRIYIYIYIVDIVMIERYVHITIIIQVFTVLLVLCRSLGLSLLLPACFDFGFAKLIFY